VTTEKLVEYVTHLQSSLLAAGEVIMLLQARLDRVEREMAKMRSSPIGIHMER
jgi:hypothetical protein